MKLLLLTFVCFIFSSAQAAEMIVLTGYVDKKLQSDFENSSKAAYEYSKRAGDNITFAAGLYDGLRVYSKKSQTWKFIKPADAKPLANFSSTADLKNILVKSLKKLKEGEPLKIFINDHGTAPHSESDELSSGFYMSSGKISHEEFEDVLKSVIPKNQKVILVGAHCYSGGLHNISFDLPNMCSASASDFRTTAVSGSLLKEYGETFWNNASGHTLSETQNRTTEMIYSNDYRSQISSMAYIDKVLGVGPYKERLNFFERVFLGKLVPKTKDWKFEKVAPCYPKVKNSLFQTDLVENTRKIVEKMYADFEFTDHFNLKFVPKEDQDLLRSYLAEKYDLWKKNKKKNYSRYLSLGEEYHDLSDIIKNGQYQKSKVESSPTMTIYKRDPSKPRIPLDRYDRMYYMQDQRELYKSARRYLSKYFGVYKVIERADRIEQFYKVASEKQKKKFIELLKCEQTQL